MAQVILGSDMKGEFENTKHAAMVNFCTSMKGGMMG